MVRLQPPHLGEMKEMRMKVCVYVCERTHVCVHVCYLLRLWQQLQQLPQRLRPVRLTVAMVNIINYRLIGPGGLYSP